MFGLAVWLGVGALTALLFGALVSWSRHSWDEADLERISIVAVRRAVFSAPVAGDPHEPRRERPERLLQSIGTGR
jgi:hypothetical protein